ncbi:Btz domain-containing protein [Heracleum sosnowskyi]|uniref:Btz domain-containing protein n=1 Tax=Heracleum sosnowskyi TaxID=360622 RepID=A0AAD8M1C5_9APIA|nr:Btz domain-containing protein [Heracleum sosnowskyi]
MASVVEDELEYESDPEESKMSLIARRRVASDDEDEEDERDERDMGERVERDERDGREMRERVERVSESESEGAVEEYDDESEEFDEEEVERDDEVEVEEGESEVKVVGEGDGGGEEFSGEKVEEQGEEVVGEEKTEKKENEPFAVPTAGAFYMHDDRFRDGSGGRGGGRHRRNLGGRNLWESKDDRKWGHDKFEEMSTQERHYGEGRKASRGRNRGRGKIQGEERGYARGSRPKTFNNGNQNNAPNNQTSRLQNNSPKNLNSAPKNPNNVPKGVRGRGPRRYQSYWNEVPIQNKQHGKSADRGHYATSTKVSERPLTVESDQISAKRHVSSSLNSASPPFYPSASSKKEISATQKRDGPAAPLHRNLQSSVTEESFSSSTEKNLADVGMNKLYIDNSASTHTGKPSTSSQLQVPVSSWTNSSQYPHSRVQGRVQNPMEKMAYQTTPQNQVNRVSNPSQHRNGQKAPTQTRQGSVQTSGRQLGQRIQASLSPDSALTTNSFEFRETKSPQESSKSNTALIGKGKSVEGNGRGSFSFGGAQVIGASGALASSHGDVNFPGMPTFLPVMQFGGQHPGGIGVPAVGMAFPGYVNNPGSGNSEMTWLPVLAGPAGALGASYNSPYLSVDGTYNSRPTGQVSSLAGASSKENNVNKTSNGLMPSQKQDIVTDEFGPRQNKPRRYTEMKFDQ